MSTKPSVWHNPLPVSCSVLVALALLVSGCSPRTAPSASDSGATLADAPPATSDAAVGVDTLPPPTPLPPRCYVAIRTDQCCPATLAATAAEIAADPCLVRYPAKAGDATEACRKKIEGCDGLCGAPDPPSRVADFDGARCVFADECRDASDCGVALDYDRTCCICPLVRPRSLIAEQRCLVEITDAATWPPKPKGCDPLLCGADCRCAPPPTVRCVADDGAHRARCMSQ